MNEWTWLLQPEDFSSAFLNGVLNCWFNAKQGIWVYDMGEGKMISVSSCNSEKGRCREWNSRQDSVLKEKGADSSMGKVKVLRFEVADPVFTKKEICRNRCLENAVAELKHDGWIMRASWLWKRPLSADDDLRKYRSGNGNGIGMLFVEESAEKYRAEDADYSLLYMTAYCHQVTPPVEWYDQDKYVAEYEVIETTIDEHIREGWDVVSVRQSDPVRVESDERDGFEVPGIKVRFRLNSIRVKELRFQELKQDSGRVVLE